MRLDKYLSHMKTGSRREVREMIRTKRVTVNGAFAVDPAMTVRPGKDKIFVDERPVVFKEYVYLMMNKPAGYLSATRDRIDKTVMDLLPGEWSKWELFPVGRLDKDTEGLLLLTNDGRLAHSLLSPRRHIPKTYYVKVSGDISKDDCCRLQSGVTLNDGYVTKPAEVRLLKTGNPSELELTIFEGKYHQVKRMMAAIGKPVSYLRRTAMGGLVLDPELRPGEVRELKEAELNIIKSRRI